MTKNRRKYGDLLVGILFVEITFGRIPEEEVLTLTKQDVIILLVGGLSASLTGNILETVPKVFYLVIG